MLSHLKRTQNGHFPSPAETDPYMQNIENTMRACGNFYILLWKKGLTSIVEKVSMQCILTIFRSKYKPSLPKTIKWSGGGWHSKDTLGIKTTADNIRFSGEYNFKKGFQQWWPYVPQKLILYDGVHKLPWTSQCHVNGPCLWYPY